MSNLVEAAVWEAGIYQLEVTDPVEGGPEGIDNLQAKQLGNRTAYLKGLVESMGLGLATMQPSDATLTALAALATAADKLIYCTGADTFALTPFTAFARTLLDDADAATARATLGAAPLASPTLTGTPTAPTPVGGTNTTQLATTAFVQAAVAALVNASPAALDTLAELATALGNDANFATTMTNALAGKAPLASPALTGTPTAPTAVGGTNTTQLATTAFVQAAVAALVNAAPAALNTLAELATALGNDANFATTMTNALAGKAPLASPALTGTPTAPTPAGGTNTTQLATTAFVVAAIAAAGGVTLGNVIGAALAAAGSAGVSTTAARSDHVHPYPTPAEIGAAPLASPTLTGTPTAPTPVGGTNTTQLATTAFVQAAVAALVNASPAALDTLAELATALGNDANFATTMTNALAGKQAADATLTALAALGTSADKLIYATGADAFALTTFTAFARSLLDDADAAAARATLGAAALGANTFTGTQSGGDNTLDQWKLKDQSYAHIDKGIVASGVVTFDYTGGSAQRLQVGGALTISTALWPAAGGLGELLIELVNGGASTITWPTINWVKSDGTTTTTFSSSGYTLQSSGTDWVLLWSRDGGTTIYGKVVR